MGICEKIRKAKTLEEAQHWLSEAAKAKADHMSKRTFNKCGLVYEKRVAELMASSKKVGRQFLRN